VSRRTSRRADHSCLGRSGCRVDESGDTNSAAFRRVENCQTAQPGTGCDGEEPTLIAPSLRPGPRPCEHGGAITKTESVTLNDTAEELECLTPGGLASLDAWWRAANHLTIGQIYLKDNALLRRQLTPDHIKPRLLGHWGTSPGLSFVYAHVSRLISVTGQHTIYLAGPGHGGPALVGAAWLEGTYSEIYPAVAQDGEGMQRLFRQFSSPGGIPSHVSVTTPGSIHEGGELGYVLIRKWT
jgi:hypothetical protein